MFENQKRAEEITVEQVNGKVPVYAGASATTTKGCIRLANMAYETREIENSKVQADSDYSVYAALAYGGDDHSSNIKFYEKIANIEVTR